MRTRRVDSLRRTESKEPVLSAGSIVRGRVLGCSSPGRFKVKVGGWLLEADSDLPLEAGQKLVAQVDVNGQKILLRLQDDARWNPQDENETEELRRALLGRWISVILK